MCVRERDREFVRESKRDSVCERKREREFKCVKEREKIERLDENAEKAKKPIQSRNPKP